MTPKEALASAITIMTSQTALAAAIGPEVKTGHVYYWLKAGQIPAEHCPAIERATSGQVRCEDLRPDVDWAYLRQPSEAQATEKAA